MDYQIDTLLNGHKIYQDNQRFMFGIDAILLADFAASSIRKDSSVIDLGTGTGIIPLILDTTFAPVTLLLWKYSTTPLLWHNHPYQ